MTEAETVAAGLGPRQRHLVVMANLGTREDHWKIAEPDETEAMRDLAAKGLASEGIWQLEDCGGFKKGQSFFGPTDLGREVAALLAKGGA